MKTFLTALLLLALTACSSDDRPRPDPLPEPDPIPAPVPDPAPEPAPEPDPVPEPDPEPIPEPDPVPEPDPDIPANCQTVPESTERPGYPCSDGFYGPSFASCREWRSQCCSYDGVCG